MEIHKHETVERKLGNPAGTVKVLGTFSVEAVHE